MIRTGIANLPLHSGHAPMWLFSRMVKLAKEVTAVIVYEYGQEEFLRRVSNPFWFQAFSCILGYDWHSSGTTTVTCGALKTAIKPEEFGFIVCGGKGRMSRRTCGEIEKTGELFSLSTNKISDLKYASKLSAKVDNSCVQDGYQLYHHCFIFTEKGKWAVVQQGMNDDYARRYHWLSDNVKSFVEEPHEGIACDRKESEVLDLTAKDSKETRETSLDLIKDNPAHLKKYFLPKGQMQLNSQLQKQLNMPRHHPVLNVDIGKRGFSILQKAHELQPENYEELVSLQGVGAKSLRALALVSSLVFGAEPSWKDPAKFSFAHGGKDGHPYFTNRGLMDESTRMLKEAIEQAKLGRKEKICAIKRLQDFLG